MKMKKLLAGLTAMICMAGSFAVFPELTGPVRAAEAVHNDFEVTYEGWYSDGATLTAENGIGYEGTRGMLVSGRNAAEDGASSSKGFYLYGGVDYTYSVQVKSDTDETFHVSLLTIDQETGEENTVELVSASAAAGEWTMLSAKYEAPKNSYEFKLTITTDSTADFYFDEVNITTLKDTSKVYAAPAGKGLKDEFANYFRVGNILNGYTVTNSAITAIMLKDHNAIECENETKPDATIVQNGSTDTNVKVTLNSAAAILDFCVKNNIAFRGHTLVWHSQTPEWFFKTNFDNNGSYVSTNVMDQRMESYIKNMFDAYNTQYPTLNLYAYDVCNEVVYDGTANNGGARPTSGNDRSAWVQVYGNNSFVEKAFTYARRYAPADCKLYYNDYNEFSYDKQNCIINTILKPLYAKGLLDGMGMQSHVNCAATNAWGDTNSYLAAMDKYLELGIDVQVTELDLSTDGGTFTAQQQADKYKAIFQHAMDVNTSGKYNGKVTLVQVWGPNDGNSWVGTNSNGQSNSPLLYDANNQPKLAYTTLTSMLPDSEWGDGSNPNVEGGTATPVEPNEYGWFFHHRFEGDTEGWTGRGAATVANSSAASYLENESLYVSGRTDAWNGASYGLNARAFVPGEEFSFSVNVMYKDGGATDTFFLKLQYTDANGDTQYSTIAEGNAVKGEWMQLANTNYKIPADASGMQIYVETEDSTVSFYMDEAIGAVGGVRIEGAGQSTVANIIPGDVNGDGVIDVFDLALAKRGLLKGFANTAAEKAADVDKSGTVELADLVQIYKYLHKLITHFTVIETPTEQPTEPPTETPTQPSNPTISPSDYMEQARASIVDALPWGADQAQAGVDYGTMQKYYYYSTTRERQTPVNVLLPAGYNENESYPVLYMMHGYWETEDTLAASTMGLQTILGNLVANGEAKKMIVVFPYIYTSKTQEACSGLDLANSLNYDNFINDLKADLMPWVQQNFSIKTGRENTAISGFSMGGRESQFIGLTMSDTFGYVGAVCPAPGLTPGYDLSQHPGQLQESDLKFANMPYLFLLSAAVNDGVVGTQPEAYHNIYNTNGVDHIWNQIPGGGHDGNSIRPHFYNLVRNLFKV